MSDQKTKREDGVAVGAEAAKCMPVLLGGPYRPPEIRPGDRVYCVLRKRKVRVTDISLGPIPWPRTSQGRGVGLILCGDLIEAVRREAARTVVAWWGADPSTVGEWRRALGVAAINEGTRQLLQTQQEKAARAALESRSDAIEPRPLGARRQKLRHHDCPKRRHWRPEEEVLLGTMSDAVLARQLGCSRGQVWRRRHELDIPAFLPEGSHQPAFPASHVAIDPERLAKRREESCLTRRVLARMAGVNYDHYLQVERGGYGSVRRVTAERIASALNYPVEEITVRVEPAGPEERHYWSWADWKPLPAPSPSRAAPPRGQGRRARAKASGRSASLLRGPYNPPEVRAGDKVHCALRGHEMTVVDWTDGPVPWPCGRIVGIKTVILSGDLIKAVRTESNAAVATALGVGGFTVSKWRRALGVPENNEGTLQMRRESNRRKSSEPREKGRNDNAAS